MLGTAGQAISTILKHDLKVTSYKLALLRSINDVVLSFPDLRASGADVAVPLRMLAEFWIAYYWPFCDPAAPVAQGQRAARRGGVASDMEFRPALTAFRALWEQTTGVAGKPADGFFVVHELRVPRRRASYPQAVLAAYELALRAICSAMRDGPIRHAGPGQWEVFAKPRQLCALAGVVSVPGTQPTDACLVVQADLWGAFADLSQWVEALSVHEWCLFTENVTQRSGPPRNRGEIYWLLTDRPDNRRPLTWERHEIDLLIMEGAEFVCPWTRRRFVRPGSYDLDHIVPLAVYPINELWNLVPADPYFNSHRKRNRLPSPERLAEASPRLARTYEQYGRSGTLCRALAEDVGIRFSRLVTSYVPAEPWLVARAVCDFAEQIAGSRNLARF